MGFKRIVFMGGISVVFTILSSLLAGGDAWGQDPLVINYTSLSMNGGTSQNLSASGGCPPYTWILYGGGTITPSGGYTAPASNPKLCQQCNDYPNGF